MRSYFMWVAGLLLGAVSFSNAAAQDWTEITPGAGSSPAVRWLSSAIYDPAAHTMVIFAGDSCGSGRLNDVWSFDLSTHTWADITPSTGSAPVVRLTPASVYDGDHYQMLTFSGQGSGGTFLNDTWKFDLTSHTWAQVTPLAPLPTIRYGVATCYDVVGKTQVIFAGFTSVGRFDDTWRFDPAADTWNDVSPVSGNPLERCLHGAAYDAINRRMIMYGGQNGGALGDIWSFDLATETWTQLVPTASPDPRWFSVFEYDRLNHRITMFSGNRNVLGRSNDVWVFDLSLNDWIEIFPAGTPPLEREGAAGIYVHSEDRLVIFGGSTSGGMVNDVWSLNNLSGTPTGTGRGSPPGARVTLHQNYPNPFNPSTMIRYELPTSRVVQLAVFDVRGREVRRLFEGRQGAGPHAIAWDGRNDAGYAVSSGVYVYRLQVANVVYSRKMVLIK